MFHLRREARFPLHTADRSEAAGKARDIYLSLIAAGWEATLAKFKPEAVAKPEICTIGEFLADVRKRSHLKPKTFVAYAETLRRLVCDIAKIEAGLKGSALRAKHDLVNGGNQAWRAKIEAQRVDILTPDALNAWRNQFVARAGSDPFKRKSAERSAASYLRNARSLFTRDIVPLLKVALPPNPFAGVRMRDPGPQRYHSGINPVWLVGCAERELREAHPQQFLAFSLCLWAGLRRKEADLLRWEQVDLANGQIHVRRTAYFEPKTEESQRDIDLAPLAVDVIRRFKAQSRSEFVLEGEDSRPEAVYDFYRCDRTWRDLHAWLREKGIRDRKAIHALRKESGSLVASAYGIEAARQHLGHRDIHTTSAHYVDKKMRIEVAIPMESGAPFGRSSVKTPELPLPATGSDSPSGFAHQVYEDAAEFSAKKGRTNR
ncbi:MAG TPA: tyrosine-type recombinase/integrase [Opitutaceae bacterium]|nr:tyrosine-type recombinase/integrase [Opitutaceae bacterium]